MEKQGEIILYQPDEAVRLEVRLEDETVWLTQAQIAELFQRDRTVITKHINNVFKEKELEEKSNVHFLHIANSDKPVKFFSLDVIISVGNSKGIILPSEILKQLRLSLKSTVSVSLDGNNIVIKAQPRQGWAEAAKRAHENGDDELLIPDVFEDEKFEDWTW